MYCFLMHALMLLDSNVEIHVRNQSNLYHSTGHLTFMGFSKKIIGDMGKDLIQRYLFIIIGIEHNANVNWGMMYYRFPHI